MLVAAEREPLVQGAVQLPFEFAMRNGQFGKQCLPNLLGDGNGKRRPPLLELRHDLLELHVETPELPQVSHGEPPSDPLLQRRRELPERLRVPRRQLPQPGVPVHPPAVAHVPHVGEVGGGARSGLESTGSIAWTWRLQATTSRNSAGSRCRRRRTRGYGRLPISMRAAARPWMIARSVPARDTESVFAIITTDLRVDGREGGGR